MTILSALIFMGIPLVGVVAALVFAVASIRNWNRQTTPAPHYIASRMLFEPTDEEDAKWLSELDSLKLPYRHTIC